METFKKIINRLLQFFQDDTGALSAMRLLFIVWGIGTFIVWTSLCIKTGTMVAMDIKILGFLVSLVGGKVVQNFTENKP